MATIKSGISKIRLSWRELVGLGIVLLLLYAVLPQLGKFRTSIGIIENGHLWWMVVAQGLAIVTSLAATSMYWLLAKQKLRFGRTLSVELASLFVNRLVPAGVGSLGLNFEYLRRNRHDKAQAGAVIATNVLLGFLGHIILLSTVLIFTGSSIYRLSHFHLDKPFYEVVLAVLVVITAALIILAWFKKLRSEIFRTVIGALRNIRGYRTHPLRLLSALLVSIGLTSLCSLCLLSCAYAAGVHLSFGQILIVLTVGVAGSTIVPTPGGLIGTEAGLFAGLIAYKASGAEALAVVLTYRFITYWVSLAIGAGAWIYIRHRNYI